MPGPIVERGDRVSLRTAEERDLSFLQRACTDPDVRYALGKVSPMNESELADWLSNAGGDGDAVGLIVCLDGEDAPAGSPDEDDDVTPIGNVNAWNLDDARATLAYWLLPEYHGEGYGKEAVGTVVDFLFRTYDIRGVEAAAYDFNAASRGLLESLGFVEEGRARKSRFVDGEYRDSFHYGLLREEWDGRPD